MARITHAELYGTRDKKYSVLGLTTAGIPAKISLEPDEPYYLFVALNPLVRSAYDVGWKTTEIFPVSSVGIVTARDHLCVQWSKEGMWSTVENFASLPAEVAREKYDLGRDARDWKVELAQKDLKRSGPAIERVVPILYRPFDTRFTYFTGTSRGFLCMPRGESMRHFLGAYNLGLVTARSNKSEEMDHFFVSASIMETKCGESTTQSALFPLYRYPTERDVAMGIGQEANLSPQFLDSLSSAIEKRFDTGNWSREHYGHYAEGDLLVEPEQPTLESFGEALGADQGSLESAPKSVVETSAPSFSPEDVFQYIYAVLHSPSYRSRYAEFLKIDFPRIPLPGGPEVFDALVPLGGELVALHLMESPRLNEPMTTFIGQGAPQVEKVSYTNQTVWINKDQTKGFQGVPESVWNFHIGGYQVCEKWLKDRGPKKGKPGRTLTPEDIDHYHRIVVALSETIRIMAEIDNAIEAHGGWPGAFQGAGQ